MFAQYIQKMCGIAGIVRFDKQKIEEENLSNMLRQIIHRGPDDHGTFITENVGLGHRRLSIIDLTSAGHQPFHYGDYILVFNGEIYNYIELKETLKAKGLHFNTSTDSEVLVAAYKYWGEDCVNYFNGMWSFVIYDRLRNIFFCSRDRFGKKPFFYTYQKNFFAFCSEIKGLIPVMGKLRPNYKVLTHFVVLNQTDNSDDSFFDNISKLPAGHNGIIHLDEGTLNIYPFYSLNEKNNLVEKDLDGVVSSFQSDFSRSIMLRLRSDVTVGTCLSGGLDSSYLAAVASENFVANTGNKFTAVTAGSIDKAWDETHYAEMVARHLDLNWIKTTPDEQMFKNEFENVVLSQEEPFHSLSVFMQYFVMKSCKEAGITVLLNGQGADEVLMGYFQHVTTYLKRLPFAARIEAARKITQNFGVSPWYLFQLYHYFNNSTLRIKRQLNRWRHLNSDMRASFLDFDHVEKAAKSSDGSLFDYQAFEINSNFLPMLLRYEDKNSMAFSIESRLPYLDYQLVENFLNSPERFRIVDGWTKYVLRKAMEKQLPHEIVWRKKKFGFIAPTKLWLADEAYFSRMISESKILNRMLNKVEYPRHDLNLAWRMISVAAWERKFDICD